ncbi:hypothetical protein B0H11DRAFT_2279025 [Mycena galericulata]|nr:hypothetical protein B0H11DRAFT_2279025 [Mycena galericulata]
MRTIHALSQFLIALIVVAPFVSAADQGIEPTDDELKAAVQCRAEGVTDGVPPKKTLFAKADGKCTCDLETASESATLKKCVPPTADPRDGLAVCRESTSGFATCFPFCFHNADLKDGRCVPYPVAASPGFKNFPDDCEEPGQSIAAFKGRPCTCSSPSYPDGGDFCKDKAIPANSDPICQYSEAKVGDSRCSYQCKQGFEDDGNGGCKGKSAADTGKSNETASTPDGPVTDRPLAKCAPTKNTNFWSPTQGCNCERSLTVMKRAITDAVQCPAPTTGHGKAACLTNADVTKHKCTVDCDKGYKTTDGTTCVADRKDEEKSETTCSSIPPMEYLSADPVLGCVCKKMPDDGQPLPADYCGPAPGGEELEQMCSDKTNTDTGVRTVECTVKCPAPSVVSATNKKLCEEPEADDARIAAFDNPTTRGTTGTCLPPKKLYRLPGKQGCKCQDTQPTGGTECTPTDGTQYSECIYRKGKGVEAFCGNQCKDDTASKVGTTCV